MTSIPVASSIPKGGSVATHHARLWVVACGACFVCNKTAGRSLFCQRRGSSLLCCYFLGICTLGGGSALCLWGNLRCAWSALGSWWGAGCCGLIAACILVSTPSDASLSLGSSADEVPSCRADCRPCKPCCICMACEWHLSAASFCCANVAAHRTTLPSRGLPPESIHAFGGTSTCTKRWSGVPPPC